ncbi:MAG: polysaccharide biosynthesis C-terminal domain-containing protein, partial [Candidatus Sumerlaeaceae bacterium]|nr:polysaccharide biosynthesis C-terminal domain-containing protein [Candidatus Sumerlaeaceae bacterium]
LYMRTGTIALSNVLGEEAVGYYNAPARLPEALQFLPTAVINSLIPFLSRHHDEKELIARYYQKLVCYLGYAALIFSGVLILSPEWIIRVVAKEEYLSAVTVFRFCGVWLLLVFYQIVAANFLICLDAEKIVMMRAVVALLLNIILNVAGIRLMGLNGAVLALVLTETVSALMYLVALARRGVTLQLGTSLRLLAVGLAITLPVLLLNRIASDTLRVAAGVVSGIGAALFLFWRDDRTLLAKLVEGK